MGREDAEESVDARLVTGERDGVDLEAVARLVVEDHGAAPACVAGAARFVAGSWRHGWGRAGRLDARRDGTGASASPAASLDHLFDLASLTKPVVALVFARLARHGIVRRDEPLGRVIPELAETASGAVALDLLSAHRAGLEAHREMFEKRLGVEQPARAEVLLRAAEARRSECRGEPPPAGFAAVYSDLGYVLLGAALEARTQKRLDALVEDEVAGPLGLRLGSVATLARARAPSDPALVFAPTEDVPWRGGLLAGIVHDENAWVLAGTGTAGHAGLFGDVAAVVGLGTAVLDAWEGREERWLRRHDLEPVVLARPGGSHAGGFDRRSGPTPSSGQLFGAATFGHLGFTGTSIWIDPDVALVGALLTNRVHPTRDHIAIRSARPAAYDALYAAMMSP